jgi:hypothetical protein
VARELSDVERARLLGAQRVLQRAVGMPGSDAVRAAHAAGWPALELDERDARALGACDVRRIDVYRKLVRGTLAGAVAAQLPRTKARLGDAFARTTSAFFDQELPRSPILRDVPFELARWAAPRWSADAAIPAYAPDLARWELFEFDVLAARRSPPGSAGEGLAPDRGVAFDGTVRVGRFAHAVHELPDDAADTTVPAARPVGLLGHRDTSGAFRHLELTPLCTTLLVLLFRDGAPLAPAVRHACELHGEPLDRAVVEGTAAVLADLAGRGAVLGSTETGPPPAPSPFSTWLCGADPWSAQ